MMPGVDQQIRDLLAVIRQYRKEVAVFERRLAAADRLALAAETVIGAVQTDPPIDPYLAALIEAVRAYRDPAVPALTGGPCYHGDSRSCMCEE